MEAALAAEPAGERDPIQADTGEQDQAGRGAERPKEDPGPAQGATTRARESSSSTSATSSCVRAPRMAERATSTMSRPSRTGGASSRHVARRIRRARLRTTAPPTRRPATNATDPEPSATNTTTRFPWVACPVDRARATFFLLVACSSRVLGRQARAALGPAPGDDGAAGAGPHPDPEAVSLGATADVRLIRSLGHRASSGFQPARKASEATSIPTGSVADPETPPDWPARKCDKRRAGGGRGENLGAIVRRASSGARSLPTSRVALPPRVSTYVERLCG